MDKISDKLINVLAQNGHYVTSNSLAEIIGVSTKTVYRKVHDLNHLYTKPIIKSERGKGYYLDYNEYLRLSGQDQVDSNELNQSPLERRNEVLTELLFNAPLAMDIQRVYEKYYVSGDLIKQDLLAMAKLLDKNSLVLRHRGKYVSIVGDEQDIRHAINASLMRSNAMKKESINDLANEFENLTMYDNQFLTAQLEWIQKSFNTTIPYPYNVNIFSHLFVLIKRFRNGKVIKTANHENSTTRFRQLIDANPRVFKVSNDIIRNTADYVQQSIPEIESYYLMEYLISMRYNQNLIFDQESSSEAIKLADYYIQGFGLKVATPDGRSLENDLVSHIRPMMNRLRNGILIANKLLDDIKSEYGTIYEQLQELSQQVMEQNNFKWEITSNEIGFLTLYFAKYFEEVSFKKRALVMCASGIGTSKLLYARIHNSFPNLELVGVTSKIDYEENPEKYQDIDLIVSTVPVEAHNHATVILSSAMFNSQDKRHLSEYLEKYENYL